MSRVLQIVSILGLLLTVRSAHAQTTDTDEDKYTTVTTYGVTTNTNSGILGGFVFRHSKALPNLFQGKRQFRYLALEIVNVKHPKEVQSQTPYSGARYVYNKQNYLFVVRPQYGREVSLFSRTADEGIAINGILAVGPSIGVIKPYYVQYTARPGQVDTRPFDPSLQPELIVGAGSFFQGFDKSKLTLGLNFKAAVAFELSAFRNNMTGLEIGFLAEAFPKEVVIMNATNNRSVYTSGFVTLFFGNKK
ncbi:hypothetical protein [Larkinella rosea]|uniref:hypothetical protein n=1 Tax=Larkinella rosea TaxID=2025312 RepID=UPI001E4CAA9C|nr:hypothetical protein [Larkinella rosea]